MLVLSMLVHNIDTTLGSCHGLILDLSTSVRVKLKLGAQVDPTIAIYR